MKEFSSMDTSVVNPNQKRSIFLTEPSGDVSRLLDRAVQGIVESCRTWSPSADVNSPARLRHVLLSGSLSHVALTVLGSLQKHLGLKLSLLHTLAVQPWNWSDSPNLLQPDLASLLSRASDLCFLLIIPPVYKTGEIAVSLRRTKALFSYNSRRVQPVLVARPELALGEDVHPYKVRYVVRNTLEGAGQITSEIVRHWQNQTAALIFHVLVRRQTSFPGLSDFGFLGAHNIDVGLQAVSDVMQVVGDVSSLGFDNQTHNALLYDIDRPRDEEMENLRALRLALCEAERITFTPANSAGFEQVLPAVGPSVSVRFWCEARFHMSSEATMLLRCRVLPRLDVHAFPVPPSVCREYKLQLEAEEESRSESSSPQLHFEMIFAPTRFRLDEYMACLDGTDLEGAGVEEAYSADSSRRSSTAGLFSDGPPEDNKALLTPSRVNLLIPPNMRAPKTHSRRYSVPLEQQDISSAVRIMAPHCDEMKVEFPEDRSKFPNLAQIHFPNLKALTLINMNPNNKSHRRLFSNCRFNAHTPVMLSFLHTPRSYSAVREDREVVFVERLASLVNNWRSRLLLTPGTLRVCPQPCLARGKSPEMFLGGAAFLRFVASAAFSLKVSTAPRVIRQAFLTYRRAVVVWWEVDCRERDFFERFSRDAGLALAASMPLAETPSQSQDDLSWTLMVNDETALVDAPDEVNPALVGHTQSFNMEVLRKLDTTDMEAAVPSLLPIDLHEDSQVLFDAREWSSPGIITRVKFEVFVDDLPAAITHFNELARNCLTLRVRRVNVNVHFAISKSPLSLLTSYPEERTNRRLVHFIQSFPSDNDRRTDARGPPRLAVRSVHREELQCSEDFISRIDAFDLSEKGVLLPDGENPVLNYTPLKHLVTVRVLGPWVNLCMASPSITLGRFILQPLPLSWFQEVENISHQLEGCVNVSEVFESQSKCPLTNTDGLSGVVRLASLYFPSLRPELSLSTNKSGALTPVHNLTSIPISVVSPLLDWRGTTPCWARWGVDESPREMRLKGTRFTMTNTTAWSSEAREWIKGLLEKWTFLTSEHDVSASQLQAEVLQRCPEFASEI
ncbi:MAG: uncharacterized protein KVP18_004258 [Porospora cf. gigantea A]|nr:MAG: hypothetical protein KVP18_004258 [Porospora cf. gigantea A]